MDAESTWDAHDTARLLESAACHWGPGPARLGSMSADRTQYDARTADTPNARAATSRAAVRRRQHQPRGRPRRARRRFLCCPGPTASPMERASSRASTSRVASELAPERFYLPRAVLDELQEPWVPENTRKMLDPMTRAAGSRQPARREEPKLDRNALGPCGSGKKHKRCCGARST